MTRNLLQWGVLAGCALMSGCDSSDSNSNALQVSDIYPAKDATNRALVTTVTVAFNHDILAESFDEQLITLSDNNGTSIEGTFKQDDSARFTFIPSRPLPPNTRVSVKVSASVMSQEGLSGTAFNWQFTTAARIGSTSQAVIDNCMDERDISMLDSVNTARSQSRTCGSEAMPATTTLRWNCLIEEAAQIHSDDMVKNNFFDHTGSDGSNSGDRMERVGYDFRGWGENIAAGQRSVESVMAGWLESPGHCSNLMSSSHQEFGLGYAEGSNTDYTHYWTQKFASPAGTPGF